jgi:spore germination cell wall hydrolase CwlJ-like protein
MNRMKQRHLSALKVVLQPYQFSCWNKGAVRREYKDYEMVNAIRAWELAKNSKLNVNHYHADYCNAYWAPKMEFVTQIGKHLFYTDR